MVEEILLGLLILAAWAAIIGWAVAYSTAKERDQEREKSRTHWRAAVKHSDEMLREQKRRLAAEEQLAEETAARQAAVRVLNELRRRTAEARELLGG